MMVRLFENYGSAVEPQPVVVTWEGRVGVVNPETGEQSEVRAFPASQNPVREFNNMTAAREFAEETPNAQVGGIQGLPAERVTALEHYRLVYATNYQGQSLVKTFERVPGASVEGSGATPGQEVRATVEMEKPSGQTFQYTQFAEADENGNFELHLPYSTTGYDNFGPENGYTNTAVEATGPYRIATRATADGLWVTRDVGELDVSEAKVVGEDDTAATVELEEQILDCPAADPECPIEEDGDGQGNETTDNGTVEESAAVVASEAAS
jgi:dolichyl-diphosphooligosaccharide--protein glycosyltransferase